MNTKKGILMYGALFIALCMIPLVSAQIVDTSFISNSIVQGLEVVKAFFTPFLSFFVGATLDDPVLGTKVIFFLILFAAIRFGLQKSPLGDNNAVVLILSFAVPTLIIKYISNDTLESIAYSYGTIFSILFAASFLIIMFVLLEFSPNMGKPLRMTGWTVLVLGYLFTLMKKPSTDQVVNTTYVIVVITSLLFMLADTQIHRTIQKFWEKRDERRMIKEQLARARLDLQAAIQLGDDELISEERKHIDKLRKQL